MVWHAILKWNEKKWLISLLGCEIGDEGAKWLSEALKVSNSIENINTVGMKFDIEMKWWANNCCWLENKIGEEGAKSPKVNNMIKNIDIRGIKFDNEIKWKEITDSFFVQIILLEMRELNGYQKHWKWNKSITNINIGGLKFDSEIK